MPVPLPVPMPTPPPTPPPSPPATLPPRPAPPPPTLTGSKKPSTSMSPPTSMLTFEWRGLLVPTSPTPPPVRSTLPPPRRPKLNMGAGCAVAVPSRPTASPLEPGLRRVPSAPAASVPKPLPATALPLGLPPSLRRAAVATPAVAIVADLSPRGDLTTRGPPPNSPPPPPPLPDPRGERVALDERAAAAGAGDGRRPSSSKEGSRPSSSSP